MPVIKKIAGLLLIASLVVGSGCFTAKKERQLNDEIFSLKRSVSDLQATQQKRFSDNSAAIKMASQDTNIEKIRMELQKIKGEIGALRIGVMTGQLPGTDPEQEGSIAYTLNNLITRLENVEKDQKEILEILKKAIKKRRKQIGSTKKRDSISGIKDIKRAFASKRYRHIVQDAPKILKKKSKKRREEILYYYAESLYKLGKLREAALQYNDFVDSYAASKKVPHAKMRMGDCFRHLGDTATAKLYYLDIVEQHGTSSEAKRAKEHLERLK